jgi:hypothetical protein
VKKAIAAAAALNGEEQANGWMDGWRVLSAVFLSWKAVEVCNLRSSVPSKAPKTVPEKQGPNLSHTSHTSILCMGH